MKGQLHIIYPDKPIEVRFVNYPLPFEEYQTLLNGHVDVLQLWDHHLDYGGKMQRAIVLYNDEAPMQGLQFNLTATAIWQFVSRTKGTKHDQRITGPVVVCMGDEEFLDNVLD